MIKKVRYILMLVILFSGAIGAQAQVTLPEQVCVGTTQHYWVTGLPGSTYTWRVNGEIQSTTADNIDITWTEVGDFTLEVQEHQLLCNGDIQTGVVSVTDLIIPEFALIDEYCSGSTIPPLPTISTNGIIGTWTPAISNTLTTIYTFTPADDQCATTTAFTIIINDQITPEFAQVGPYCAGSVIDALPTTSNNGITGTWAPEINNLATTTYTFTPEAGQCGTITSLTIEINDEITPTFAAVGAYCAGATIDALPTTSTNDITGTWSPAINNQVTTTYTFTPIAGQCATPTTLTINITDLVTPSFAAVAPVCSGTAINLPLASLEGITGTWSPSVNNTATTTYTFTPDATFACATTAELTITITNEVTPTFATVAPICSGTDITLPLASLEGITGTWSPAIDNQNTTTYTFTPGAGNDCATTAELTITITNEVTPTFATVAPICSGTDITLPLASLEGITGTWSPAIDNQNTTTYTFTPGAGNDCATTAQLTITITDQITPTFDPIASVCRGAAITLPASSLEGITGSWTPAIDNQNTTTYTFTPGAENDCATTAQLTITITDQITPTFEPIASVCRGTAVSLPVASLEGITGTWSPAIDNQNTTTYTFTPGAENDCATTATLTITITDQITPTFDPIASVCRGTSITLPIASLEGITGTWSPAIDNQNTTTYTFTPGAENDCATTAQLTITITDQITPTFEPIASVCRGTAVSLPVASLEGITGTWSPAIDNQNTTTYTFTPGAGNDCATTATLTITITDQITPTFEPIASVCRGTAVSLPVASLEGITGSWSPVIDNQNTTTYTFTPGAGNDCATTATLTITITDQITPTFEPIASVCRGAAINLPTASLEGITGSWSPAIDNQNTTTYTFTPGAGNDCATTAQLTITITDQITPTFDPIASVCRGTAVSLPVASLEGITGTWSPAIDNQNTTTYTFTPGAGNDCATTATLTITITDQITPTFDPIASVCRGSAINLPTASLEGITGSWSPAIDNQNTTTYTFTPGAGNDCAATATLTITITDQITPTFDPIASVCRGAAINLPTASLEGITGTWSPAIDNQNTTTYTFTPGAGNDCATTATLTITITDQITPTFDPIASVCRGAAITLPASSLEGITGTWSPAIDNQNTTTYTFTPGAGNDCATTAQLTITITDQITPTFEPIASVCRGTAVSLPVASLEGITGTWTPAIDNQNTTTYTFTPGAGNDCATASTLTITITDQITPTFDPIASVCRGAAINLPTTSLEGITGSWSPAIDNQNTTTYTFTPGAGNDCATTATLTITITDQITPTFDPIASVCRGTAVSLPVASLEGITGSWSPAIDNQNTTTYTFTPGAGNDCATTATLTITITDQITPTFDPIASVCRGTAVSLPVASLEGITGTWTPAIDNQNTTTYTFTPGAGNDCATTAQLTITITDQITPTFEPIASVCRGTAVSLPVASLEGITGTWTPAIDNQNTTTYTFTPGAGNDCATTAQLTITITDQITPTFDPIASVCRGAAINLPTASLEGITGSWSPAIDNQNTTTYTFTPGAGNDCATTAQLTITITDEVTPTFATVAPVCSGTAINLPIASLEGITGTWSPAIDNQNTTTYTFTPGAGNDCATTATLTITITDQITPTFEPIASVCRGAAINLPTASLEGITGSWSPAIDNQNTTTYTFTPGAGNDCATTAQLTITITDQITPTFDPIASVCRGAAINLPTASLEGITGSWSPAIDNQNTTTYTFTPGAGNDCATTAQLTITITDEVTPTFATVAPVCSGTAINLPIASLEGITGTWSPAIDNTTTTTYTFTPDASFTCATTAQLTITIIDQVTPTFDEVGPYNPGSVIASLPIISNNGINGTWDPEIDNTRTTTYTFTPDDNQCALPTTLVIEILGQITPSFDPMGPLCSGTTITLPETSTNGITGSWSPAINNTQTTTYTFTPDPGQGAIAVTLTVEISDGITPIFDPIGPLCSGSTITLPETSTNGISGTWSPDIDNTQTTTYTFTPDAGQCGTTATLTISVSDEITPIFESVGPFCAGTDINELPTTSTNGIRGSWSPDIDNTETTTYTFTPDDGQCGVSVTLTITISDEIEPIFDPIGPLCNGSAINLPAISNNGITGIWSPAIDNTQTTEYTFTPDEGQCGVPTTLTVEISDEITPAFEAVGPYCAGADIDDLPTTSDNGITGSWSPAINNTQTTTYTFIPDAGQCGVATILTIEISSDIIPTFEAVGSYCTGDDIDDLPTTSTNGITGTWAPSINNMQTTTYTFTPEEGQCAVPTYLTISITNGIVPTFDALNTYCPGENIDDLPTTSNNGITGSWSPNINNQQTTTYTFTPDNDQCAIETTLTIVINSGVVATFDPRGTYCPGAAIADLPTTSNNGISGSWSPEIDNSRTTTYTFTPDEGQCALITTMTIVIEQGIVPTFDLAGSYCPGETIAELPTESNNGISGSWSPEINNTRTTTYTFTPDDGQCALATTLTIIIDQSVTPTFDDVDIYCPGEAIAELPTTSNNGIHGSWNPEVDNTRTTTYTFTPDDGQCAIPTSLTIVVEGNILPDFDPIAAICAGSSFTLPEESNNGISGSWSPAINNTQTTTYTFIPDNGQCGINTTLTVEVDQNIIPTFDAVGPYCPGESIDDLPRTSNNDISGSWSPEIDNSRTTTYTFTPDDGQCASTATLTININQGIIPTFDAVGPYCLGDNIDDLPTESNNGISGSWSPDLDDTQSGTYTFTPDDGQCATNTLLSIVINEGITPTFDPVGPFCPGAQIAELPTTSNNGIRGSWRPAIDNSQTTTYRFTADDGECPSSTTLTIEIDPGTAPTFDPVGPYCPDTEIVALPAISTNGIKGTWSPEIDNTQTTTYTFTPDEGQCGSLATLTIEITDQINPTFDDIAPVCSGTSFTLPVSSSEGIAGTWSPEIDNTQTTTYTFTPDGGSCSNTATLRVEVLESITPEFSSVGPFCPGSDIDNLPTVSNNDVRGSWSPSINNMVTTTYTFTPEDGQCAESTTLTIEIQENSTPTFEAMGPYCPGADIQDLPNTSREGIRGTWSPDINNTQSTTYTFTPNDGQCSAATTLTITITDQQIPTFDEVGPYCPGSDIAALPTTSNNGIRGSWSPEINNDQTTTYTFTPEGGECATTASLTIVVDATRVPTFDSVDPICQGMDITLPAVSNNDIRGSWSPAINNTQTTTYTFTPEEGQCAMTASLTVEVMQSIMPSFDPIGPYCPGSDIASLPRISNNGIRGSWSPEIDNTQTTTYTFTPDDEECVTAAFITILIEQDIVPTFDPADTYCPGSDIASLPTTSNNGIRGTWSPEINNLQTTTYTFTPDEDQCASTATLTIFINSSNLPTFEAVGPFCPGVTIPELPTTSTNGIHGSWSPEINNLRTTTYTFTPDAGECGSVTTLTIFINQGNLPTFEAIGPFCRGENIASLPTTSTNGIHGSWSPEINNNQTTTYTFTPDEGECGSNGTMTIVINQPVVPTFASVGPYCSGQDIDVLPTLSNNGIRGSWSPGINNSETTTYTFTPEDGQCGAITTLTININNEITPTFAEVGPYCGGSAIPALPLISTNGVRGTWIPAIDNSQTTTYTFTPNSGQCGIPVTMTIEISDEITPTFDPVGPYCGGASISLPVTSTNGIRGSWSPAINNQQTTTYTFTPNAGQCGIPTTITVEISDEITPNFDAVGPYCHGSIIAALPTTSNNGISGSWRPAINNTQTTAYTFTPDPGQCGTFVTLTITILDEITPEFTAVGPFCQGEAIDDLTTTSNNGITGVWSPAIDNARTTTYTFTPDDGQCGRVTRMTITINDEAIPTFTAMGPYCAGSSIPALPVISNNGVRGTWSPAIDNSQTTTYTFTPEDGQCGEATTLTIEINDRITPTFDPIGPYSSGSVIAALPTLSTNGIRGTWAPAINNTQTTTYTFTPNAGQCGTTTTLTIEISDEIVPTFDPVGPYCAGSAIDALPTISTNNIRGSWSPSINNTRTTTYTFTPEQGQTAGIARLTITINDEVIPTFTAVGPYCAGTTIDDLPTTSINGILGTWSPAINNSRTTTYTFIPEEGQCGVPVTMIIEISNEITPTFAGVGPYCTGSTIPALPIISNNGIRGTWSPAINNTRTNTYTFTPDAGQCGTTTTLTIDISDEITPTFAAVGPFCPGSVIEALPTTSINGISGSWSPAINNTRTTTYTFTPQAGQCGTTTTLTIDISDEITPTFAAIGPYCPGSVIDALPTTSINGISGSWSPAINNTRTTTYTFNPDAGQCGTTTTLTIEINDAVEPTFAAIGPYCSGSVIDALPTTSINGISGSWSPAINNTRTTTYTFTPQAGQCGTTTTLTIEINDAVEPTFAAVGPFCPRSVIDALPTTSINGIRGTWSPAINNTRTTTYTFTPDAGQCGTTTTLTIEINDAVEPTFAAIGPYCPGSVIDALPTTSINGIRGTWAPAINNTRTTTYTFTPQAGQCGTTTTLTIEINDAVEPTFAAVGPYCEGSTFPALPAVSNNGIRGSWSPAINTDQTTTYTFTPDEGQCGSLTTLTIEITDQITPTFASVGPFCAGTDIDALPGTSINGIRGTWIPAINNSETTTYIFTPNGGQCGVTTTLTIEISDDITPTFAAVGPFCPGAEIDDLPTTSTNGIRGTWSPAINNTRTTTYTFTPDAGQCGTATTLTIEISDEITPTFAAVGPYCPGLTIPALSTTSINGITGSWTPAINNAETTTYTFTPNADQCAESVTMTIEINEGIIPAFIVFGPYCTGSAIPALPSISTNGIRGSWSPEINNTQTSTYTFVPDEGQCAEPVTITIEISDEVIPTFDPIGPYCPGTLITALPAISNNGISGSWSPVINNTRTTTYTFTPDPNQCGVITTMTIEISEDITPTFDALGPYCTGSVIAALPVISNNGISGTWRPAINNNHTTTYSFTPDAGQCGTSTTLTVEITDQIVPVFDPIGPFCPESVIPALPVISNNGIRGSWSPAINNTRSTNYTFTPDAGQCAIPATLRIVINQRNIPTFDAVGSYCSGSSIAALRTVSNNGVRGRWRPEVNNRQTTTYTFTPDDAQCNESIAMTIEITDEVDPTFNQVGPFNAGTAIAALRNVSNNGIRGTWRPAINNRQTTTYTFTPDGGQCSRPARMTIEIVNTIVPTFDQVGPYCAGAVIPNLPTISNNGIRGTWSPEINNTRTTNYVFTPNNIQTASIAYMTIVINEVITPTFAEVGPYCPGTVIEDLPTTSINNITGTWSPEINNEVTTTYTFTPDAGQCAVQTTLIIEINDEITPTFTEVGPFCPGTVIEDLPTTSLNNITGTWSPEINNQVTTTYTFTPEAGQCGEQTTLIIEINDEITPTFAEVGPFCPGTVIEELPTTSLNNITGTWSPEINNQVTTTYTFTPDEGQCGVQTTLIIEINDEVTPTFAEVGPFCPGTVIEELPTTSLNNITGTWSPEINNQVTTTYTFTPEAGHCGEQTTLIIEINEETTPIFAAVGPYCAGSAIDPLPNTSMNGISGTWGPAIDNTRTTTYTFIPDAGQCADTVTLTIEIDEPTIPEFALVDSYCIGSAIADLPLTSINNIRGTWSPAINNIRTTTYTFIPDSGQCASSASITITISPELNPPVVRVIAPDCSRPTGTIEVVSPHGAQYQYSLDGGTYQSAVLFTGLVPESIHTISLKDISNGCESMNTAVTIDSMPQIPELPIAEVTVIPKCNGGGVIEVTYPIGTNYEYRMDGGGYQANTTFTNVEWGQHFITVRDVTTGCISASLEMIIPIVMADMDFDGITDELDADVDGDGIANIYEGSLMDDNDGDGQMNYMDIDADADGIVDNLEAQNLNANILPSNIDKDQNGLDDAYEKAQNGVDIVPLDTDLDGNPDFMDLDSDDDQVPDFIEGHDVNANGLPDHYASGSDRDKDGLDDAYDTVTNECNALDNAYGSNAPMQDFEGDGSPDWRDENDDDDEYLTKYEDLNSDNDYSNDDLDFDGYPEYLDFGRECDLFIPDAFSPNGDDVHDLYQIYCINHYPNAKIYIFDQLGNKIYEKLHYGNIEYWKTPDAAWWDGKPTRGPGYVRSERVNPGTYYYVLDLGNGEVKKSFVFVSY